MPLLIVNRLLNNLGMARLHCRRSRLMGSLKGVSEDFFTGKDRQIVPIRLPHVLLERGAGHGTGPDLVFVVKPRRKCYATNAVLWRRRVNTESIHLEIDR